MATLPAIKCAAVSRKMLVPLWRNLISGMWPCGWHGTTRAAISFHTLFLYNFPSNSICFSFRERKEKNFLLFTSHENMASLKTLLEVSITETCILWLPQHTASELLSKKENIGHWSYGTRDSMKCYNAQTENLISYKIKTLWNFNISNVAYTWLCIDEQAKCRGLYW